jgi:hypothetical protein
MARPGQGGAEGARRICLQAASSWTFRIPGQRAPRPQSAATGSTCTPSQRSLVKKRSVRHQHQPRGRRGPPQKRLGFRERVRAASTRATAEPARAGVTPRALGSAGQSPLVVHPGPGHVGRHAARTRVHSPSPPPQRSDTQDRQPIRRARRHRRRAAVQASGQPAGGAPTARAHEAFEDRLAAQSVVEREQFGCGQPQPAGPPVRGWVAAHLRAPRTGNRPDGAGQPGL